MAIAFDAQSTARGLTVSGGTVSFSHTTSGSNRILFVGVQVETTTDSVTGATYNGVSMTLINKVQAGGTNTWLYLFYLLAPATGANNVIVSGTNGDTLDCFGASYTGVGTGQPDASATNATGTSTTFLTTLTTIADNCWTVEIVRNGGGDPVAGTNSHLVSTGTGAGIAFFDHNAAITPAGSFTMNYTGPNALWGGCMASFSPGTQPVTASVPTLGLMGVGT